MAAAAFFHEPDYRERRNTMNSRRKLYSDRTGRRYFELLASPAKTRALRTGIRTTPMDCYKARARAFLDEHNFEILIAFRNGRRCPPNTEPLVPSRLGCAKCGEPHGDCYRVTIHRLGSPASALRNRQRRKSPVRPSSISFDVWGPHNDRLNYRRITDYEVLACLSPDAASDRNTLLSRRLQRFFSPGELDDLAKI